MSDTPNNIEPERSLSENMIDVAMKYLSLDYRPIPLPAGSKGANIKWKPYQTVSPTVQEVKTWFGRGDTEMPNIALVTGGGLVVVDVDDPALLGDVLAHCGETPMRSITPSGGVHLFYGMRKGVHYGNSVRINDKPIDLRCEGSYVVEAWSRTPQGIYKWDGPILPVAELPLLKVSYLRERKPKRKLLQVEPSETVDVMVRRARGYLAMIEPAISGANGHKTTMRVAGVLVQKFGLSIDQAMPLFEEWNEHCEPQWSSKELLHKLQDAVRLKAAKGLNKID